MWERSFWFVFLFAMAITLPGWIFLIYEAVLALITASAVTLLASWDISLKI